MFKALVDFIKTHSVSTVFDIGCGTCEEIKPILPSIPRYIGADIDPRVVDSCEQECILFDITKDPIPNDLDLILCRDLFSRFTLNTVLDCLEKIRQSNAKYVLITSFINREFTYTGSWQAFSLFTAPFFFPMPVKLISEECSYFYPRYIDKSAGIWKVDQIPCFIPRKIFQTWHSKELPPILKATGERIRKENPDFEHKVFDLADCELFIQEHFGKRFLDAYQKLVPRSYKADLWRYCVLYVHGGIYLDISFEPINNFRFSHIINKEHFSSEVRLNGYNTDINAGVSVGFLVVRPGNQRLLACIHRVVENIETENYGKGVYDITSATALGKSFTAEERASLREVRRVVNTELNGYTHHGQGILRRMKIYDAGLPGRTGQAYLEHWYARTAFHTTPKKTESDPQA
jgi:SAM-dependent methyltransferase